MVAPTDRVGTRDMADAAAYDAAVRRLIGQAACRAREPATTISAIWLCSHST